MSNQQGTNNIIQNLNQGSNQYYPISQPPEGQVPRQQQQQQVQQQQVPQQQVQQQQVYSLNGQSNVDGQTMNVPYGQNITGFNNNNYQQIKTFVPTTQNQTPMIFYQQQPMVYFNQDMISQQQPIQQRSLPPPTLPPQQLLYASATSPTLPQNTLNPQSTYQQPYYSPQGGSQIVYENPINFQPQQPTQGQPYYVTNVAQPYGTDIQQHQPPSMSNSYNTNVYSLPANPTKQVYQLGTLTNENPPKHIYIKGKLYRLTSSRASSADGRTVSNMANQDYLPQLPALTSPMIKANNSSRANSGNRSMTRVNSMFLPKVEKGSYASRAASLALTESSTTFNSIMDPRNKIELPPIGQIKEDYQIKLPQLVFKGQPESTNHNIINNNNSNINTKNNGNINTNDPTATTTKNNTNTDRTDDNNDRTTSNATVECGQVENREVNPLLPATATTATSNSKKFAKKKETGKNISEDIEKKKKKNEKTKTKKKYVRPLKFECEICQKKFHRQDALQTHMNMHLNINPYECSVCGKCFNAKQNMVRHERNHGNGGRVDKRKKQK